MFGFLLAFGSHLMLASALDGHALADLMNAEYHSYNPSDPSSGIGVYLRLAEETKIYCNMPCFQGKPDCKISGSLFNDKQMIDKSTGRIAATFGKAAAWYINTTKVRTHLAKCSFAWDGGTDGKVNGGCGCNPGQGTDCANTKTAFYDKCDGQPCTDKSPGVASCECANMPMSQWPTTWGNAPVCFWKGPAFYPAAGDVADETHQMLDWRVQHQDATGAHPHEDQYQFWNEMVLDGERLVEAMQEDSMATMPAIVYFPSVHGEDYGRQVAQRLVNELKATYNQPSTVPIIRVDESVNVAEGGNPFQFVQDVVSGSIVV